ncbi:uncharacterized protein PV06_00898 [Exophiala oligosperma]|uniref:Pre-mRNA-splicing factor cwc26 n=2 Tax=Chaetothyriales TaxID=34395 RepID=A0A0D2B7T2_9EURO|nr:uncharacterized protein PV06_00898 [Exophiala oligosperma]KAJ9618835.1 Pre-mRNA-splicing factor cwc26 [Knufia peltigerae]KIW48296.1 hypothetical protein PV06_00898 [Exophiala oligosperma]
MPSSNLAAYLAKNYLTASNSSDQHGSGDFQDSTRPKKKRRRNKDPSAESGLVIADDDESLTLKGSSLRPRDDEDGDMPIYDTNVKSAEFRKKKGGGGWKVIAQPDTTNTTSAPAEEDEEADRILAAAAEEADARRREIEDEDAPAVVDDGRTPRMSSGAKAGLQTAADTARLVEREERERERELAREQQRKKNSSSSRKEGGGHDDEETEAAEETIYRDATGRRIDISMKRAEARAAEEEKRRAERQAREDAMGDVQRREKEARKQDLEEAKFLTLARGAEDEDMNEDLKRAVRWDDPMAAYMAQKQAEEHDAVVASDPKAAAAAVAGKTGQTRKKVYVGAAPPNRYGISPGWRWDGVDRSNGFEKEWFQARSRKGRNADLEYQWQMDE